MKTLMFVPVVALLVSSAAGQVDEGQLRTKNSTVKVLAAKRAGEVPGSGTMIGAYDGKTYYLTACHVVAGAKQIVIQLYGRLDERVPVTVYENKCDDRLDLAVLVVDSYMLKGPVDRLPRADLEKVNSGDRALVVGQAPGREWIIRETKLQSKDVDFLGVPARTILAGDSGGPLLDNFGDLIGINVREDGISNRGRAVRADKALELVVDRWRVPIAPQIRVDFCSMITNIIAWSTQDFDEVRGAERKRDYAREQEWEIRELAMDITGVRGSSRLVRTNTLAYGSDNKTVYVANFKRQRNEEEARKFALDLTRRVLNCLPDKEYGFPTGKNCHYSSWRDKFWQTPISFVTYVKPFESEVELFMYRGYEKPSRC